MASAPGMNAAILRGVGAPVTSRTLGDLAAWNRAEGGSAAFNPFNTTQNFGGATGYNSVGVKNYPNLNAGVKATIQTLNNGRYGGILTSLRKGGDPTAFASAVGSSPWGTSGSLIAKVLKTNFQPSSLNTNTKSVGGQYQLAPANHPGSQTAVANWLMKQSMSLLNGGYGQSSASLVNLLAQPSQAAVAAPVAVQSPSKPLSGNAVYAGGFLPTKATYSKQRADQGRDLQTDPGGPIISPGVGKVVRIGVDPSGFGTGYPIIHYVTGPYAGRDIYVGHTRSAVKPGQMVHVGDILGHTGSTGAEDWNGNASKPGWAEIGFAPNAVPGAFGQNTPF